MGLLISGNSESDFWERTMMVADFSKLNGAEEFISRLRRSNILERSELEQVLTTIRQHFPVLPEPPVLADFLVQRGVLNAHQTEQLLRGAVENLVLERYVLQDAIGTGSVGTVYRARSRADQREYAIKLLPRRSMWNVRLARRYARAFERVEHPSVVPFVDIGTAGGQHYLVWPLVEGETLSRIVQRERKLSPGLAAHYGRQIAAGLACCHTATLVHGLLSPANVMVGTDGQARLLDYGIGAILAQPGDQDSIIHTQGQINLLTSGIDCGSPESMLDPSARTPEGDQYSLGCILYFCVTGRLPFEGSAVAKMKAHRSAEAADVRTLNPEVPEELAAVIARLMQKSPVDRFGSMDEVAEALQPFAQAPTRVLPKPARPRPVPATRANPIVEKKVVAKPEETIPEDSDEQTDEPNSGFELRGALSLTALLVTIAVLTGFVAGWLATR